MLDERLLMLLEALADQLGIPVSYADVATEELGGEGGTCILRGDRRIILERTLSPRRRAQLLAEALSSQDLESMFLLPVVREALEQARHAWTTPVAPILPHEEHEGHE